MAFQWNTYYEIQNVLYGTYVNLYGNHSGNVIPSGNVISLWSWTGNMDQKWMGVPFANAAKIVPQRNPSFVINRHSGNNSAIAWPSASASLNDTEIDFMTVNASANLYRLKLSRRNLFLTATGSSSTLYWQPALNDNSQLFKLISSTTPPEIGFGSIRFEGFVRSHAGTGFNLNVYGNNTITNHQNVNLWTHTGAISQKWRIQNFNGKYKVFSMLQYPTYALNIWRGAVNTNNCDVFAHGGNDLDSHIVLEPWGSYYRIKLANYDLCLTAAGRYSTANVYWATPNDANGGQIWELTTSAPPSPSGQINESILRSILDSYTEFNLNTTNQRIQIPYQHAGKITMPNMIAALTSELGSHPSDCSYSAVNTAVRTTQNSNGYLRYGIDCSGLAYYALNEACGGALQGYYENAMGIAAGTWTYAHGMSAEAMTRLQSAGGGCVQISKPKDMRAGDLIRFAGTTHVMIIYRVNRNTSGVVESIEYSHSNGNWGPHKAIIAIGDQEQALNGASQTWNDAAYNNYADPQGWMKGEFEWVCRPGLFN